MANMSGGEALAKSLAGEGVEVVFGIPGIQTYGIVAGLRDEPGIRLINTRHEQATTYMADGYARTSGKPGVALVVPGVGLYNAASGLATAYARSSPVLVIAGQVPRAAIGKNIGAVHEVLDQADTVRTVTKWQRAASRPREIPAAVTEAFRQMRSGRPRPVLIEVPPEAGVEREDVELWNPAPVSPIVPSPDQLREAARVIAEARLPLIYAGGGGGPIGRGRRPREPGRGDEHPGGHVQRGQGHDPGQSSALVRLLLQPSGRAAGDEPAVRRDAVRRRRDRHRRALLAGQSGGQLLHAGEHQRRWQRADADSVQHDPPAWRREGDHRGPASLPRRSRRG